jgi:acyl carrier protein
MRLEDVVSKALNVPLSSVHEELGSANESKWSSLGQMRLVAALEESFGVRFSKAEIRGLTSVRNARQLLSNKGVQP